ncbi:MAG: alpha-amylase [Chlorobium limicola]|uniref:alpha-amylase family glycosyl hydrolase n=1 Tax=Chlorobium limicola TaxID=1092 RepID=UPI0023F3B52E|nr:alpha-amylase family glycosyl hydrolase [Chlorobium limicola]NTV20729.1 alpha-amylase [Chlorobium limicola]
MKISNNNNAELGSKEHFYVNRHTRALFHQHDPGFLQLPADMHESQQKADEQSKILTRSLSERQQEEVEPILPAQFHGMKLLHEVMHFVLSKTVALRNPALLANVRKSFEESTPEQNTSRYLHRFLESFPPIQIYNGSLKTGEFLENPVNRELVIEESLLVWLNNQNPALDRFSSFISDRHLREETAYPQLIRTMLEAMKAMGPAVSDNIDLAELLTMPIRHAPNSILDQLRYIRLNWAGLLEGSLFWPLLTEAIAYIQDEDRYLFFENVAASHQDNRKESGWFEKEAQAPDFSSLDNAPANYSPDSSWMPEVVMIAKSTYVWLDQLSKQYRRHIVRLQDIPDEELDILAERGFTSLWLIGLWQRSPASQQIKQIQGNPEAKASAYALDRYDIADDLGGYEGYLNLRHRAMHRGIRLASDMVPNHTGLDSDLVKNQPDWFLSSPWPPYVNYTYNGPNLSNDHRYGIYIEDGYWNRSDAAVTFKRVDHMNGDTRYIYHGNDGTNMPWNDTAQLNFLSPEVREGVIQQILHVARMFPVIRFDAAMVLAKRHIQRLWFPLTGHTAAIPSRSAYAMSMADFDAAIPVEFWREVVDRVQTEVPDTLLLAEAFWMLEGYFVRTLGMHRVYNSAFMHMLKKEDNAGYRYLIKNTLEFDAEILKRYVNFMNNPDEDTAIAQFGNGDKYFGICLMMITLPGLPMFGHGQVEGFNEKYGMEYAKAYYDEQPDNHLVERHYREIFPVMKKRPLFADVRHFFLYDVYAPEGTVNENVFAYSNRIGDDRALFIYNNCISHADGWVKTSSGYKQNDEIRQSSLVEGLGLNAEEQSYVVFREHACGLEFVRSCRKLAEEGLYLSLDGYHYNLFLDFREVRPSRLRPYDALCNELNGQGAISVEHAVLSMSLAPLHGIITGFLDSPLMTTLREQPSDEKQALLFAEEIEKLLEQVASVFGDLVDQKLMIPETLAAETASLYRSAGKYFETLDKTTDSDETAQDLMLATDWIILESLQQMLLSNTLLGSNLIDDWLMHDVLAAHYRSKGLTAIAGGTAADLLCCLLSTPKEQKGEDAERIVLNSLEKLYRTCRGSVDRLLQIEYRFEKAWFREQGFTILAAWLRTASRLREINAQGEKEPVASSADTTETETMQQLELRAFLSGYEMGSFFSRAPEHVARMNSELLPEHI